MSDSARFWLGALGGGLPVLVSLLGVDLAAIVDHNSLTVGNYVGYGVRTIVLITLGGVIAYLNPDVKSALSLVQLGISAPALIASYINSTDANRGHAFNSYIMFPHAYAAEKIGDSRVVLASGFLGDFVVGLTANIGTIGIIKPVIVVPPNSITAEPNVDRPNKGDYLNVEMPSLESCQNLCLQDIRCKAYTFLPAGVKPNNWHGASGPHCWLKDLVPDPKPYHGFISGVRLYPPTQAK